MALPPQISVVIPVYGCESCLVELHRRLAVALDATVERWEILFVEDRSGDESWARIRELAAADPHVRGLRLSRNFGQHAAITAGLAHSAGDWTVVMDCDLQEPPEVIGDLYRRALETGCDVVLARRRRKQASWPRRVGARIYYGAMAAFSGVRLDGDYGTFSIISRKVVDAYAQVRDRDRHYLLIINWLGFDRTHVDFDHQPRPRGRSSYSLLSLAKLMVDGIFFQTTVLLKWIVYAGFVVAALGGVMAAYVAISRLSGNSVPGWSSLAVFVLTIGGFTIISTGITGLYIGKVFDQVKGRPLYVVDREIGEHADEAPHRDVPDAIG